MMTSRHARIIHPFRTSGTNAPGYSRPPQPPQTPQASQRPADDWDEPQDYIVALGQPKASPRMREHITSLGGVYEGDPPRVAASTPTVSVHIDGQRVMIPNTWAIASSSTPNGDMLIALDADDVLHLLRIGADGTLRELHGISDDLLADLRAWKFPRGRR